MTIRRSPRPSRDFTILGNATIEDTRLSFKALGLLIYLLSKPDHWTINREHLSRTHTDGTDSVRSGLRELRDAGYIVDEVERDATGKITSKVAVVHETPQDGSVSGPPCGGKPASKEEPQEAARPLVSTDGSEGLSKARTENPPTPHAGQLALVEPPTPPAARRDDALTLVGFDAFWRVYPLKVGKGAARKAWDKAIRRAAAADIIAGAQRYAADPNRKPDFTKYAEGWLNAGRWEDDPLPAHTPPPGAGGRMGQTLGLLRQRADQRAQAALGAGS